MKLKIAFILAYFLACQSNLFAQPNTCAIPGPVAADDCVDACLYCDLDYNGYSGISTGYTPDGGNVFCGQMHNNQWFAFMALTTTVEFTVEINACQNNEGLQSVIYPDCNPNSGYIVCNGGSGNSTTPLVLTATTLTIGEIYWFSIDGYSGDKCDFNLSVTQGTTSPPLLNSIGPIRGDSCIYPGEVSTYTIDGLPGPPAPDYAWTWPAGVTGTATDTSLVINWGPTGGQICVEASNFCNSSPQTCIDVFVHDIIPTELVEVLCEGDCYTLGNIDYCVAGFHSETFDNFHGCDSIVNLNLSYYPAVVATGENFTHCVGEAVVLSPQINIGEAPYSYLWDTGEITDNITVTSFNAAIHTVTITDFCGTTTEVEFNITIWEAPEAYLVDLISICADDPVGVLEIEFFGPGPWSFTYMINGVLQVPVTDIFESPYYLNVTEPGDYELVSVNNPDCPGLVFGVAIVYLTTVELAMIGENPSCFGVQDGIVNVNVLQGDAPYFYSWNNGAGNIEGFDDLEEGIYSVTVTDNLGCTGETSISLIEPDALATDAVQTQGVDCNNAFGGSIDLTVFGGINPYTFLWNNGAGIVEDPDGLTAGMYVVTVADLNDCVAIDSVEITSSSVVIPSAVLGGMITCMNTEVSLDGSGSTGEGTLQFEWYDPNNNLVGNSAIIMVNTPGLYNLIISDDATGCTGVANLDVMADNTAPTVSALVSEFIGCNGNSVVVDGSGSTGSGTLSYEWIDADSNVLGIEDTLEVTQPGNYTFIITDNTNGCTAETTVEVQEDVDLPQAFASADGFLNCTNQNVWLDGSSSSGNGTLEYLWLDDSGNTISTNASVEVGVLGIYTLVITDLSNNCTTQTDIEVALDIETPNPIATTNGILNCTNQNVWLDGSSSTGNGTLEYLWLDDAGNTISTNASVEVGVLGIYTLVITDLSNNCTAETTAEVEQDASLPQAIASVDGLLICTNQNVWLDGSSSSGNGILEYLWLDDAGNTISTNASVEVGVLGIYTLVITDLSNNCTTQTDIEVVLDIETPNPIATTNGILNCTNQNVWLDGSSSTGNGTLEYLWLDDAGNTISTNTSVEVGVLGIYTLVITDLSNNCTTQTTVEVELDMIAPNPEVSINGILNCTNLNVELNGSTSTGIGALEFLWLNTIGAPMGTNETIQVSTAGFYTLVITDSQNGCTSETAVEVLAETSQPVPEIIADGLLTCSNINVMLDGNGSSALGTLEFEWLGPNNIPIGTNETVSVNTVGMYTLIITDIQNNCSASTTFDLSQDAEIPVAIAVTIDSITCINTSATIDANNSTGANVLTYEWYDSNGNPIGTGLTISVNSAGSYELVVTDVVNGCGNNTFVTIIGSPDIPIAMAQVSGPITCTETMVNIDGSLSSGTGPLNYEWFDMGGGVISQTALTAVNQAGDYNLVVTDINNGCTSETNITVEQNIEEPETNILSPDTLDCDNTIVALDGSNSVGIGLLSFEWYNELNTLIGTTLTINATTAGTYSLVVTDDFNGCSSSLSVVVNQNADLPTAIVESPEILTCQNLLISLDGSTSSGIGNLTYEWFDDVNTLLSNDPSIPVNSPGTYTLNVIDISNDCSATTTVEVFQNTNPPIANAGLNGTINCNQNAVDLDGSGSSGNGLLIYEWFDEIGNTISNNINTSVSQPGIYHLEVTDTSNGCISSDEVVVFLGADVPFADASSDGVLDCNNTVVNLGGPQTATGNSINYEWLDETAILLGTNVNLLVTTPGLYVLVVMDTDNGCVMTDTVLVNENLELPIVDPGLDGILNCNLTTITLGGLGNSSGPEFTYGWLDSSSNILGTDSIYVAASPDNYTLLITNTNNGCTASSEVLITEDIMPPIADAGIGGTISCDESSIFLNGSNSSGNNLSFEWFDEDQIIIGSDDVIEVLEARIFTLVVTNTINGCTHSDTVEVLLDENLPEAIATVNEILTCAIPLVTLDGSASTSPSGNLAFEWYDASNQLISNLESVDVNLPGIYTLTITDTQNGCTSTTSTQVNQDIIPPIAEAGESLFLTCGNDLVTLNGSGSGAANLSFEWFDDNATIIGNTASLEVASAGIYNLLVTNTENGCTANDQTEVLIDTNVPAVEAGIGGVLTCGIQELLLEGTASNSGLNMAYEWQNAAGNTLGNLLTLFINEPGTYTLIVTDTILNCTAQDEVMVTENMVDPFAQIDQISALNCTDQSLVLNAGGSIPIGNLDFTWSTLDGNVLSGINTLNPEIDEPGTYLLTVTDLINGCTDTATILISQDNQLPEVNIDEPSLLTCVITEQELSAINSSVGNDFDYSWTSSPLGGIASGGNTLSPTVDQIGQYTLTILNATNGCENSATVTVNEDVQLPIVVANVEDELDCITETLQVNGDGSSFGSTFSYNWSGPNVIAGENTTLATVNTSGIYTLLVTNATNGCTQTAEVTVEENTDMPEAMDVLIFPPLCFEDDGTMEILFTEGGQEPYLYSIDEGQNFYSATIFNSLPSGTYSIIVQDAIGCEYEEQFTMPYVPELYIELPSELVVQLGEAGEIQAYVNIAPGQIDTIIWTPAEGLSCTDCLNPIVNSFSEMQYAVSVIDTNGCAISSQVLYRIEKARNVYIPSAFSPNNADGINDRFMIYAKAGIIESINTFQVFSRWGEMIFQQNDFMPNDPATGWDGFFQGEALQPGVFVYWVEIYFVDGFKQVFKGDVTLMR
jgi:gliding motility-associated-like protein